MKRISLPLFLILMALLASCNLSASNPEPTATTAPKSPPPAPVDALADTLPTPTFTLEPTATLDPYANITHTDMPGDPVLSYYAFDCNTGRYTPALDAPSIGGGCDAWDSNFIERPTNGDLTIYYPHLDIVRFQMGTDDVWMYAEIQLYTSETVETILTGSYGVELDFDVDGQGEVLIFVNNPSEFTPGEWYVTGVEVWEDANNDVGGDTLIFADETNPGDGYETMLFDQGLGDDPDLAWARLNPEVPSTLEIAFKRSLLQTTGAFLWWTWASQEPLDPALFDYVDTYADGEVFQIENSCRWIYNGPPQPVPNICPYLLPTQESQPGQQVAYCWMRQIVYTHVVPFTCQVCPNPCPSGYECGGPCNP